MTHASEPFDQQQADALAAYGDALVEGHAPLASTDIEHALVRLYRVAGHRNDPAAPMPADVKTRIWEDLMASNTPSLTPSASIEALPGAKGTCRPIIPASTGRRGGWQAMASFVLVLAVLAALVTLGWQQGIGDDPGDSTPTSVAAQGLYDDDDISTFPMIPEMCVPNGEVDDAVAPEDRSVNDWITPAYAPARAVPYDTGEAIQQTYLHYLRCEEQAFTQTYPPGATSSVDAGTPVPPLEASPAMRTYFSDRLRFDHMYVSLSPEQQAELDASRCMPRVDSIMETFPLPVNQPQDYAVRSLLPNGDIDELQFTFSPSDVYLMPDGRYGAISGTVTTAALDDPNAVTKEDHLTFIAFVEEDGRYYIDELFTLFAPNMDTRFPEGRNGTIVMNCD